MLASPWLIIGDIRNRRISEFASLPALAMLVIVAISHPPSLISALVAGVTVAIFALISSRSTPETPLLGPADVIVTAIAALALATSGTPAVTLLAVLAIGGVFAIVYNALPSHLGGRQPFYPFAAGIATSTLLALLPILSITDKLRPT